VIDSRDEDGATLVVPTDTDPPPDVVEAWVCAALRELPEPLRLRATLVTLELVARARRCPPYVVRLIVLDRRRTLAVSVEDCTPASGAEAADADLTLVAGLSSRCGVEQRARARTTWAELAAENGSILLGGPDQPRPRSGDRRAR
jgi:hypothetical protein